MILFPGEMHVSIEAMIEASQDGWNHFFCGEGIFLRPFNRLNSSVMKSWNENQKKALVFIIFTNNSIHSLQLHLYPIPEMRKYSHLTEALLRQKVSVGQAHDQCCSEAAILPHL